MSDMRWLSPPLGYFGLRRGFHFGNNRRNLSQDWNFLHAGRFRMQTEGKPTAYQLPSALGYKAKNKAMAQLDLTRRSETPAGPKERWNCEDTYADVWLKAIEDTLGRKLTGNHIEGQAMFDGERGMVDSFYLSGLTVEGAVHLVLHGDEPMCEGGICDTTKQPGMA